jgi:hypothetical protein
MPDYRGSAGEVDRMTASGLDMAKMVRMLCVIALLCLGFAHRAPAVETGIPPADTLSYMLPDGTVPVLCLPQHQDVTHHHDENGTRTTGCEACRLGASVVLPAPVDLTGLPAYQREAVIVRIRQDRVSRQIFPANALPRGPPASRLA